MITWNALKLSKFLFRDGATLSCPAKRYVPFLIFTLFTLFLHVLPRGYDMSNGKKNHIKVFKCDNLIKQCFLTRAKIIYPFMSNLNIEILILKIYFEWFLIGLFETNYNKNHYFSIYIFGLRVNNHCTKAWFQWVKLLFSYWSKICR